MLGRYDLARARAQLMYQKDPAPALQLLQQAASRQPQDPLLMNSLGALLTRSGHPQEALAYYQKAIALKPDYHKAHYNYILALGSLGRWDEARLHFSKSLKGREPNLEKVLLQAQVLQPDLVEAESLVESQPQNGQAWLQLAQLKLRLHMVGAGADLEKSVQWAPKNVDAWAELGLWRAQQDDRAGAAQAWQEALRLSPQGAQAPVIRQQLESL